MPSVPFLRRFFGSAVSNAAGYSVGGAITPTLEPYTQSLANEIWQLHQSRPLSASQAAQASLRGIMEDGRAREEASMTGYDGERYAAYRRLAANPPALDALLALWRRHAITDEQLDRGLAQNGIHEEWRPRVKALAHVIPSVEDQVRFAVREAYSDEAAARLSLDAEFPQAFADAAELIGLRPEDAKRYWRAHWNLPSFEQLAQMLFRTDMDEAEFEGALKAIDIAPVWRQRYQEIARLIPTREDMVTFGVREAYDDAQATALGLDLDYPELLTGELAKHGITEDDAHRYWRAHWRLPSARQGADMLARDEINDAQYMALLKALDYPKPWRSRLAAIARIQLGRIDIKRAYKLNLIDRAEVVQHYLRLRYTDADAEIMAKIADAEKAQGGVEQPFLNRAKSRLYTVAHNEYLQGSIKDAKAREVLISVGAHPSEADAVIATWKVEDAIGRKELTASQVIKLYGKTKMTREDAFDRLIDMGYTPDDANLRLDNAV